MIQRECFKIHLKRNLRATKMIALKKPRKKLVIVGFIVHSKNKEKVLLLIFVIKKKKL